MDSEGNSPQADGFQPTLDALLEHAGRQEIVSRLVRLAERLMSSSERVVHAAIPDPIGGDGDDKVNEDGRYLVPDLIGKDGDEGANGDADTLYVAPDEQCDAGDIVTQICTETLRRQYEKDPSHWTGWDHVDWWLLDVCKNACIDKRRRLQAKGKAEQTAKRLISELYELLAREVGPQTSARLHKLLNQPGLDPVDIAFQGIYLRTDWSFSRIAKVAAEMQIFESSGALKKYVIRAKQIAAEFKAKEIHDMQMAEIDDIPDEVIRHVVRHCAAWHASPWQRQAKTCLISIGLKADILELHDRPEEFEKAIATLGRAWIGNGGFKLAEDIRMQLAGNGQEPYLQIIETLRAPKSLRSNVAGFVNITGKYPRYPEKYARVLGLEPSELQRYAALIIRPQGRNA